jgi:hypothetical protein
MSVIRTKLLAAVLGGSAVIASVVVSFATGSGPANLASGGHESGDSATGTQYTSPTVPAMTMNATAMSTGATATVTTAATALATSVASPTLSVAAVAPCGDKGVALPGGCH